MIRRGVLRLGDTQSARRFVADNEPVARFFHGQLTSVVSRIVGRAVKPSYVYLAGYQADAELPSHVDRAQCQYTVALCVDFTPEPSCETSWPLQLDSPDGRIFVYQAIGDALVYKGREIRHSRDPLARHTSTSLFFHYVDEDFSAASIERFDVRQSQDHRGTLARGVHGEHERVARAWQHRVCGVHARKGWRDNPAVALARRSSRNRTCCSIRGCRA